MVSTEEERAVWKVTVQVGSWKNNFTCLCFPLNKLWGDQSAWPSQADNIIVSTTVADTDQKAKTEDQGVKEEKIKADEYNDKSKPESRAKKKEKPDKQPIRKDAQQSIKSDLNLEDLPFPPGVEAADNEKSPEPIEEHNNKQEGKQSNQSSQHAQQFLDWIRNGIADGSLPINIQNALVHTVDESKDLILVSPLIFRKYAEKHDLTFTT